jgi:Ser/Thr protein kinase RdoA (MazF antagonist)
MTHATDSSRQQRALRAARRVAEAQGLSFDDAVVLRDLSNVVVWLRGSPVVARVATTTAEIRRGDRWLAREVAVASHLAAAGAPVVPPSSLIAPGPHREDGLVLSFWEWVEELDEAPDPRAAGRALRCCHEALANFDGELPRWGGWYEALAVLEGLEEQSALSDVDLATLRRVAEGLSGPLEELELPLQAVHGDAGPSNALHTTAGVLWTDWEDSFLGPSAWDLACLVSSARIVRPEETWSELALDAYGPRTDDRQLDLLIAARAFLVTVWTAVIGRQHPATLATFDARMEWFRAREDAQ